MMRSKPREEDPKDNMVLRSGTTIGADRRSLSKENVGEGKETYLEAWDSFAEVSTLGSMDQPELVRDPSMITTFLETCIKLLHANRVVKGLQELKNRCVIWSEPHVVRKLRRHALQTRSTSMKWIMSFLM